MAKIEYAERLFRVTHTVEEQNAKFTPNAHYVDTFSATFFFHGEGTIWIEGDVYSISEGVIMAAASDEIRQFEFDPNAYHERLTVYVSNEGPALLQDHRLQEVRDFLQNPAQVGHCLTSDQYDAEVLLPIVHQLRRVLLSNSALKGPHLQMLVMELLIVLCQTKTAPKKLVVSRQDEIIREICEYIHAHLDEDLSHQRMHEIFFVSRYYLGTKFQQQTGKTLTEYVIHKRLMRAASLIRSGMGIVEASTMVGFSTYSHFYRECVRFFGRPPREYFQKQAEKRKKQ